MLVGSLLYVLGPMLEDFSTYGFHDWDVETAYRYITVVSLREHGEGPWWQPYMCGGVPAFGHVEGRVESRLAVSPALPPRRRTHGDPTRGARARARRARRNVPLRGVLYAKCRAEGIARRAVRSERPVGAPGRRRTHLAPAIRPHAVGLLLLRARAGAGQAPLCDRLGSRDGAPVFLGRHLSAAAHGAVALWVRPPHDPFRQVLAAAVGALDRRSRRDRTVGAEALRRASTT